MNSPKTAPGDLKPEHDATEQTPVIDTSKMSAGQRAALELTEAARELVSGRGGFCGGLFMGDFDLRTIFPFPEQSAEDRDQGDAFLGRLEKFLREKVDPDAIDRVGEIPQQVIDELAAMGAFGIKISPSYGGVGLSQANSWRPAMFLGRYCRHSPPPPSAHQSIGV